MITLYVRIIEELKNQKKKITTPKILHLIFRDLTSKFRGEQSQIYKTKEKQSNLTIILLLSN